MYINGLSTPEGDDPNPSTGAPSDASTEMWPGVHVVEPVPTSKDRKPSELVERAIDRLRAVATG